MVEHSDHYRITTTAGWDYQTNSRGWVIYRNPLTRLWQTHTEAISIIQAEVSMLKPLDFSPLKNRALKAPF